MPRIISWGILFFWIRLRFSQRIRRNELYYFSINIYRVACSPSQGNGMEIIRATRSKMI